MGHIVDVDLFAFVRRPSLVILRQPKRKRFLSLPYSPIGDLHLPPLKGKWKLEDNDYEKVFLESFNPGRVTLFEFRKMSHKYYTLNFGFDSGPVLRFCVFTL